MHARVVYESALPPPPEKPAGHPDWTCLDPCCDFCWNKISPIGSAPGRRVGGGVLGPSIVETFAGLPLPLEGA